MTTNRSLVLEPWVVQAQDASVEFRGRASRFLPPVQARFTCVTGVVTEQHVEVDVDVRSLPTGNRTWDDLLAVADPFDADRHPVASYRSQEVLWVGSRAAVSGALELRGRSAPVQLSAARVEVADGVARLSATGRVARQAFGLRLDLPGCGALVPSHLDLTIEVTVVRQAEAHVPAPRREAKAGLADAGRSVVRSGHDGASARRERPAPGSRGSRSG